LFFGLFAFYKESHDAGRFIYGRHSVAAIAICKARVCGPRCHASVVSILIWSLAIGANYSTQRMVALTIMWELVVGWESVGPMSLAKNFVEV